MNIQTCQWLDIEHVLLQYVKFGAIYTEMYSYIILSILKMLLTTYLETYCQRPSNTPLQEHGRHGIGPTCGMV